MKTCFHCLLILSSALLAYADKDFPNILFIAVDDLKPALGSYGTNIQTPHIDRLSEQGTTFLNAHSQQAICGPSRVSVMTGKYPDATRIWEHGSKLRDRNPEIVTLPQYFKENGYMAVGMGKIFDNRNVDGGRDTPSWSLPYIKDLSYAPGYNRPICYYQAPEIWEATEELRAQGKTRWRDYRLHLIELGMWPATEALDIPDSAYKDGAVADRAIQSIDELSQNDQPFFLAVGFAKPHLPFAAPQRYWDMIQPEQIQLAEFREQAQGAPDIAYHESGELRSYSDIPEQGPIPDDLQRHLIHGYLACVAYVDAQIGRVLHALEASDAAENTIIVFWGDHGYHLGDHGLWNKHSNYEQATRVPLIIDAPSDVDGQHIHQPVALLDIFPTLVELANLPTKGDLDGISLADSLREGSAPPRDYAMSQFPRDQNNAMGYALRGERFRYVAWFDVETSNAVGATSQNQIIATEFYDYETDPLETQNLANSAEHQESIAEMHHELINRLQE